MFTILEGETVILRRKGVFRQAKVYVHDTMLFAGWGNGFILLTKTGTSLPDVVWSDLTATYVVGAHERLISPPPSRLRKAG